ncbi:hypothetical protein IVA80_10295 [Bradyrhizobium sp. 139]|uniref:hypothetical protein n=1 Tax=Bradyrhizobium sp. 139 TaxID=2782616 RepID=UPI001FF9B0B3|nr:hypothetical protein [Bradyrhizobium sp. 139]MCK1741246.1 hypothetical protein [Bradyrhizobium sp. 139]
MENDISIEEIEELEEQQLGRFEDLGIEPVDYSGGSYDRTFLASDLEGFFQALDGVEPEPYPGSKYDRPAYRKKLSRICNEFLQGCSIAKDKVEIPILGIWPGKVPGGLYGDLPESGRAILLFTEGAFSFFARVFSIVAEAYPFDSSGFDLEEAANCDVEQWAHMPSCESASEAFQTAILDLIIKKESDELRRELRLPSKFDPPKHFPMEEREVHWKELDRSFSARKFDDQCFRFLFGHEFCHILLNRGALDVVDVIPQMMITLRDQTRRAYNIEINCDMIGVEYAIMFAKATELEPEFGYAGIFLFFQVWHLVCRCVWRLQLKHEPLPNDLIYVRHPPTLIREHYAFDIMGQIYNQEETARAMKFRLGLLRILEVFWEKLVPTLDNLREGSIGEHIEPEIANNLNPHFTGLYQGS